MNSLTKSLRRCESVSVAAFDSTMRVKASSGSLDVTPSSSGGYGSWQQQARYREQYGLNRGWLYSAIHALASQGAGQSVTVARLKGKRKEGTRNKEFRLNRMTRTIRSKAADREFEVLQDHPAKDLLERPNSFQSRWQFVYSFLSNLCLTGWGYVVADANKGNIELCSLPTTWVKPKHDDGPFSSFEVRNPKKTAAEPVPLKREQVAFAHLPNPSDPLSAMAPASSQILAIRIDDHIQTSQEAFFSNGIFPSVIITVGRQPFSDTQGRPVLSGAQRRQLFGAVRRSWGGVKNYGVPAIVDGMIEKIDRLSATQNEMGWQRSEDRIRSRILSAFGVPPYVMGESVPGSYAQAYITQEIFYDKVNTFLDLLGNVLTNLLAGLFEEPGLLVSWEEKQAKDPSLQQSLLLSMRSNGDISQNELRAEVGFPPDEDLNQAMIQPSMMAGLAQVLTLLGGGQVRQEQAQAIMEGMGIPTDMAKRVAGVGSKPSEQSPSADSSGEVGKAVEELKKSTGLLRETMDVEGRADAILEDVGCCTGTDHGSDSDGLGRRSSEGGEKA